MNRRLIKGLSVCMVLGLCAMAAIADDVDAGGAQDTVPTSAPAAPVASAQTVALRTDCAAVKAELAELQMIMTPDAAQTERKTALQNVYRRDCAARAAGRRANNRGGVTPGATAATPMVSANALTIVADPLAEFLAQKKQLCDKFRAEIDAAVSANGADAEKITKMQAQFDADCATGDAVAADAVPPGPSREDVIAFLDAGLCADGSEPNKFGCCAGERFTDLGNSVFACCPADKKLDCYPPLTPIK